MSGVTAWMPDIDDFGPNIGADYGGRLEFAWIDKSVQYAPARPRRLVVLLTGTVASAHDERFSTSRVEIGPNEVVWTVDVGMAGLEKVIDFRPVRSSSPRPSFRR